MFRAAQSNPFDEAVAKATDENLTSENWEYILDVCDKVNSSETGGKDAVSAMIKRLAHRNANVQLYTLELANALSQNCGARMNKELASRSFTDALLRLTGDRNTHQQVKTKILERMSEWTEMFARDPDLGIMEQAYQKLRSQNPTLQAPSKPFKQQITDTDRQKEEEELQMALALSIKDRQPSNSAQKSTQDDSATRTGYSSREAPTSPKPPGTTAATVSRVRALYDFTPTEAGELQFRKGDVIAVLESVYKDWWKGLLRGQTGIFPLNYVEKLQDPTTEELQREAEMEGEVFGQIKNVERLLALLSTSSSDMNMRDNEEITTLYQSTVAIRPKLIELIGKYSQKKDDFTQLNEKFIKARRDYEALLESSMSQPPQPHYGRPPPPAQYGYPPAGGGQQGYAPPRQQDQQPYYPTGAPNQDPYYPPRDGPAPFYMLAPGQQPPHGMPPQEIRTESPKPLNQGYNQPGNRQSSASYKGPQELPTSNYDPTQQPQHQQATYPPQQQSQGYHNDPSYDAPYNHQQSSQPNPQRQPSYPPQQSYPPSEPPYPAAGGDPPQQYGQQQPYEAPAGRYPAAGGVRAGGGSQDGDASDFYR